MAKEIEVIVTGWVQGIMFRDFTKRGARALGLLGTVKNFPDGSVHVIAQGEEEQLKKLIERLERGSLWSRIDNVAVSWSEPVHTFERFDILYS